MASSWMESPADKDRLLLKHYDRRFRCEDNNAAFTHVRPHYYRVRQAELCHPLYAVGQLTTAFYAKCKDIA